MDSLDQRPKASKRPPYRPPIGIPARAEPRLPATVASVALHAFLILLIVAPTLFFAAKITDFQQTGAGGAGPAGGGGGGIGGTGGAPSYRERLRFLHLAQPQPVAVPAPPVVPPKPVVEKKPDPPQPTPPPVQPPPAPASTIEAPKITDISATTGSGGGSGKDGTAGNGSGSGGGVGSGVGTGRGSGNGPGTGGGDDAIYPPAVISLPILPLPVPKKVRPYKMIAYFEVDTLGNSRLLTFNPSNDGGYNRRVREMLSEIRFRPAVRVDGRPVLDTAVVTAEAPRS